MNNKDFWDSVNAIIVEGFTPQGLQKLDEYAEQFVTGRLVYQRFSPAEQHGCAAGGPAHVVASLLAGAETYANRIAAQDVSGFQGKPARSRNSPPRPAGKKNPIPLFLSRFTAKGIEGKSVNQQTETQTLLNPKGYAWASPCLDRKQAADVRKTLKQRSRAS